MTEEELEKKAEEYATEQEKICIFGYSTGYINGLKVGYIAGAKENQPNAEEMLKRLLKGGYVKSGIRNNEEKIKKLRKKLFDILTDYEIGNYDNNIHQFYKDVYAIHNELMDLEE